MKKITSKKVKTAKRKSRATEKPVHLAETEARTLIVSLMPELEELVNKNPNRLIGCGG